MQAQPAPRNKLLEQLIEQGLVRPDEEPKRQEINRALLARAEEQRQRDEARQAAAEAAEESRRAKYREAQLKRIERKKTIRVGMVTFVITAAIAWPATVYFAQKALKQEELKRESMSKAGMYCRDGDASASEQGIWGWLTSDPQFNCTEWRMSDWREQEKKDKAEAAYMERERKKAAMPSK